MTFRRILPGILSAALAVSLAACGGVPRYPNENASGEIVSADSSVPDSPSPFELLQTASDAMDPCRAWI